MLYSSHQFSIVFKYQFLSHILVPSEGESEVDELEIEVIVIEEEEVFRFEVAVCDFLLMTVVDGLHHLREDLAGVAFSEGTDLL
jgi:hypothetical protein